MTELTKTMELVVMLRWFLRKSPVIAIAIVAITAKTASTMSMLFGSAASGAVVVVGVRFI